MYNNKKQVIDIIGYWLSTNTVCLMQHAFDSTYSSNCALTCSALCFG